MIDNTTYTVFGAPGDDITVQTQTQVLCNSTFIVPDSNIKHQFTATRTVVMSRAGPVDLTVTFLSPFDVSFCFVEP
jgi:hypothetical protein